MPFKLVFKESWDAEGGCGNSANILNHGAHCTGRADCGTEAISLGRTNLGTEVKGAGVSGPE